MSQKIAVLLIHGIGKQDANYADSIIFELKKQFAEFISKKVKNAPAELVIEPVYWAPVLQRHEDKLWSRMKHGGSMDFKNLRRLIIDFAADAIAYQPTTSDRHVYDGIHKSVAKSLKHLAGHSGGNAPLCVISHSLGTVVACNYFWDLQNLNNPGTVSDTIKKDIGKTPLDLGKTLTSFYTLGSPIALWSLRYDDPDFGKPVSVPSPDLKDFYPDLKGEWINFYDKDDILGYPLKSLNDEYKNVVTADREINVGDFLSSWNPASHLFYWRDNNVIIPIAKSLAELWEQVNIV